MGEYVNDAIIITREVILEEFHEIVGHFPHVFASGIAFWQTFQQWNTVVHVHVPFIEAQTLTYTYAQHIRCPYGLPYVLRLFFAYFLAITLVVLALMGRYLVISLFCVNFVWDYEIS